jgi:DNA-binding NarL/FixJ family response regulator
MNLAKLLQELTTETAGPPKKTFGLTPRELQVAALIAEGCTNKDIAAECGIGEETVKHHLKRIFDKTGVSSRLELAVFAMNHALTQA